MRRPTAAFVLVICTFMHVGCAPQSKLVGTWVDLVDLPSGSGEMTFSTDGKCKVDIRFRAIDGTLCSTIASGKYALRQKTLTVDWTSIQSSFSEPGPASKSQSFKLRWVSEDKLVMSEKGQDPWKWIRKSK